MERSHGNMHSSLINPSDPCKHKIKNQQIKIIPNNLFSDGARTHISDLEGSKTVTLTAHMRGGRGEVAWQHTQLFRQSTSENDVFPFDVKITLKKM